MNPYVGPRRFEEQDARFFYGREQESRDLLAFVVSEPLVLFYAQSGAGKSSLIHTSLIPGLRQDNFHVLPVGRVGGNLPKGVTEVRNIFTFNLLSNLEPEADPAKFTKTMLTDYLAQPGGDNVKRPYRVLIIDQFEEIVTHHPGRWREREDFFWQLQAAIHNDPNLWVLLSMREDHFAAVESYAEILPGGLRARFRMERLRLAAAEMAIEKPAAAAGKQFEEGVAKSLVKNLSLIRDSENADGRQRYGEYVEPVQLQVVCYQLWENLKDRPMNQITEAHVQELGDVDRALGAFYDTAVQEVVAQRSISEIMLRNWFEKKLITEAHTRGIAYQDPKSGKTEGLANDAVNHLADKYLLRSERRAGAIWYELVHDRFVDPILQANANWQEAQPPIVRAALAWHESGRDDKWLMTAEQAKEELSNLDWRKLDKNVRAYAVACGRNKFQEQRREEILQTKLNDATFRIKRFLWGLGFLLVVAIITSIIAFISTNVAQNNAQAAVNNLEAAKVAQANAQSAFLTAEADRGTAEANSEIISKYFQDSISTQEAQGTLLAQSINSEATINALSKIVELQNDFATKVADGQNIAIAQANLDAQSTVSAAQATTQSIAQAATAASSEEKGVIVFVRYPPNFDVNQGVIFRINSDGSNERLLTSSNYSSRDPSWSPDGTEIIFSSNIDGDYEIYVMNAQGEDPSQWRKLTDNDWDDRGPVLSPDGQWITFHADRSGRDQIYLLQMSDKQVFTINQNGNFPTWSLNSQSIAYGMILSNNERRIATFNLKNNDSSGALTNGNDYWPSWSPDGRIAFTRLINSQMANTIICSSPSCSNSFTPLPNSNNGAPDWSPDGNQLVFYNNGGDGVNIWIMNSDGSNPHQITFSGLSFDTQPKWSP